MPIKFTAIRTSDGHALDPLRPDCNINAGIGGQFEVLTNGTTDRVRVAISGIECTGTPPRMPDDLKPGKHKVVIEQIAANAVVDTKTGEIVIVAAEAEAEETPAADDKPAAKKTTAKAENT